MSYTCLTPIYVHGRQLPCGKCGNCLQKRALEWSFRLTQEAKDWSTTSFITLTYDVEHEPSNGVDKYEIQCFLKRLRKIFPFKYYATSEYGPTHTHRPHYHILFFHDLMPEHFYRYVDQSWSRGIVTIGDLTDNRIMYCANYHITKVYNPEGRNENFCLMSKRLGANYLTDSRIDFFQNTGRMYVKHYDGYNLPMPRYYKKSLIFNPEDVIKMRELVDKQSLIDDKSLYALIKQEERINKIVEKKLKKRKNVR